MAARTYRDDYGVPHIRADSLLELAREQGRVTAQDRSWQLEYLRRRATGTAAAALGRPQLGWDVLARRTRMAETGRRAYDGLDDETQAFVSAYVEGVNAGLDGGGHELRRLGLTPQPWEQWTPLAVFHAQHVLFAALPAKLWHHRARTVLGPDEALLSRDAGYASGSNAWAVGGARTASGRPLIGGDPHRVIEAPGVYAQVRLACEDPADPFDVLGFTFPGVPGIQHFGHAGAVAWAITNAQADYQDVLSQPRDAVVQRTVETIEIRGGDPEPVTVSRTDRGPVLQDDPEQADRVLVLVDAPTVLGDVGFAALLPLLRSRTTADVERALAHWVAPVNNAVIADRAGRVLFCNAGRVPARPDLNRRGIVDGSDPATEWSGWLDLPRHEVAADGAVVTANERRGPESDALGTEFAPPARADRIRALLDGRSDLTPDDFAVIHGDVQTPGWPALAAVVATLTCDGAGEQVRRTLLGWDGVMAAGSSGAAAFAAWRSALALRIAADPAFEELADRSAYGPVLAPYLEVLAHVGLTLDRLLAADRPFGVDVLALARAALDDAADHAATWGETHLLAATHGFHLADDDLEPPALPATPVSGDIDTVRCTGWLPGITDECYRGSVARYVWDLDDRQRSGWVVPLGAAGDPAGPHHHDQLEAWAAAQLLPVVTDWARLTPETPRP